MKKYWVGVGIVIILFSGALYWNKARFLEERMWKMVEGQGKYMNITSDFCQYRTGLDPKEPDERYVKVNLVCGDRSALNTISWITVEDRTVGGIINMIKNINGIKNDKAVFDCNIDGAGAVSSSQLSVGNLITCKVL